jgi:8-oxo-dGTP pyrophosphatase MutT (NUDIX family)
VSSPFGIDELRSRLESRAPIALSARSRASVAIILGQTDGELLALFIRRAEHPEDPWSGHMALPGGRRDPADLDDLATAKRETLEEVGLDLSNQAMLLGQLDDIAATAKGHAVDMVITPFVFSVETVTPIVRTPEVVASYWAAILPLFDGRAAATQVVDLPEGRVILPAWDIEGNIVWGLTYRMMDNLLSLMRPCPPNLAPCP